MKSFDCAILSEELMDILNREDVVVVDCRFDLANPEQGRLDYNQAHIPGAYYAHLDKDLASPVTPQTGRHPLPDRKTFANLLASWGVNLDKQVIVYDNSGGSMAVRLWWLLRYFGINRVAVLDGGIKSWVKLGMPLDDKQVNNKTGFTLPELTPHLEMVVSTAEMVEIQKSNQYLIVDARIQARYDGQMEPIDLVAGHIPGAVNRFHGTNLDAEGLLKSPDVLRGEFSALIHSFPPEKVVVYCGSGVTSCHHILAMKKAGFEGVRLYAGSWSEWIRDPAHPIARS